jgi:glycosyltransferase involved in cell wall biosynthesis
MRDQLTKAPLISIVTVCYNAASLLEKTILSVINQNYHNFKYLIIDGGSNDGTIEIIKKYEHQLTYWVSETDKGIYDAMNKGIDSANGDWINFMNAGDMFYNCNVLSDIFDNEIILPDTKLIYGDVALRNSIGLIRKDCSPESNLFDYRLVCHQSSFSSLSLMKKMKFDTKYKIVADLNYFLFVNKSNYGIQYIPICISNYEVNNGLSAINFLNAFKENMQIANITKKNKVWWTGYFKVLVKQIFMNILPKKRYEQFRYFKMLTNKRFKKLLELQSL